MQIDSIPRFNIDNTNMTNIPSPRDMDFESDAIVPEFPTRFISNNNNNNNCFGAKYNRNNNSNNNNNNYSSTITPNNNNNKNNTTSTTSTTTTNKNNNKNSNNNQPLEWSTMSFSYPKDGIKKKGSIELPINFTYTPIPSSHQPFQYQSPTQVPFTWSSVNKQLISQLFKLESYFEGKMVLELGSGFGIPSIISLYLGAKHAYVTDGNEDILAILPIILTKNNISPNKYTVKKLIYNNFNFKISKNIDIILASHVLDTNQNSNSFYETISYFFDNFVQEQRIRFIKKKQKEYENKQYCTPNVRHQFNKIGNLCKHRQDLNKPITNGGYLPFSLKPAQIITNINTNTNTDDISTNTNTTNTTNTNSILSRSDDDISTNSFHTNTELPNTISTPIYNKEIKEYKYKYKTPFFNPGISSLSAITTIADIKPLVISRFSQFKYDQFNQTNKQNNGNRTCIPKLTMFNTFDSDDDDDEDDDDDDDDGDYKLREIKIDKKEENEFLSKSKVNAPILIIAIHKNHRNKDIKLRDNTWNTFYNKCIKKGYRIQNVLFEWDFEIWVVKA